MKVMFIVRGYPGLGRVMGSIALNDMLKALWPENYDSLFCSYLSGHRYLTNAGYKTVNLYPDEYYYRPNAYCNPFGVECRSLISTLRSFEPNFVVVDGEPFFIEWLNDLFSLPVMILTHPSDLYNPSCDDIAIELFRFYYSKAQLVIAHGLSRLPKGLATLKGKAKNVLEINTLIRTPLAMTSKGRRESLAVRKAGMRVVGVLGGGSENVIPAFRQSTEKLALWLVKACSEARIEQLSIFCADTKIYETISTQCPTFLDLNLFAHQIDNTQALIEADIIVGRSSRNLVSEMLALGTRSLMVTAAAEKYRSDDQYRTGDIASRLSPSVRWMTAEDSYDRFLKFFMELIDMSPSVPYWIPGNDELEKSLPELLIQRGITFASCPQRQHQNAFQT